MTRPSEDQVRAWLRAGDRQAVREAVRALGDAWVVIDALKRDGLWAEAE